MARTSGEKETTIKIEELEQLIYLLDLNEDEDLGTKKYEKAVKTYYRIKEYLENIARIR